MASADEFIEIVLSGKLAAEAIDEFVASWHASNDHRALSEALGFSNEEYALWVERPAALDQIIASHDHRNPPDKVA
jgi:hypothetical protein